MMEILKHTFIQRFMQLCEDGYRRGWHERNGGNLSYRMSPDEVDSVRTSLSTSGSWFPIGTSVLTLGGEFFLVKCSGAFMKNVIHDPLHTIGIIHLDDSGTHYQIVWGMEDNQRPTSELPSHLRNLAVVKQRTNNAYRVVYHCHPTNLIALTFVLPLEDQAFSHALWEMATECPIVFPAGIGVVPWMVPGGAKIAEATSKLMETYDVAVWAHHGVFVTGPDFDITWGLAETIEKSSEILVKVLSMGGKKQTITDQNLKELEEPFHVRINPKFLK